MSEYVIWKTERTDEMTTIQKTADLTNAARGAVARAIAELKPYVDQDLIAGAITKLQVLATAPPLEKADRLAAMSAEELTERLTMLRKAEAEAGPLSMRDRAGVQNAAADLETTYFAETNPRAGRHSRTVMSGSTVMTCRLRRSRPYRVPGRGRRGSTG